MSVLPAIPEVNEELLELKSLLSCGICFEIHEDPYILGCGHVYCNLCIRNHFTFKSTCPQCFKVARESDLRPVRTLKQLVHILVYKMLPKLATLSRSMDGSVSETKKSSASSKVIPVMTTDTTTLNATVINTASNSGSMRSHQIRNESNESLVNTSRERSTTRTKDGDPSGDKGQCPICGASISLTKINEHLDLCLNHSDSSSQASHRPTFKPLPKLVYHLLKDSQLKKELRGNYLDTKGDRRTLEQRHRQFVTLYNSQSDAERPLSKAQIAKRVMNDERKQREQPKVQNELLKFDRNTHPDIIEQKRKAYLRENKKMFDQLIIQAKNGIKSRLADESALDTSTSSSVIVESMLEVQLNSSDTSGPVVESTHGTPSKRSGTNFFRVDKKRKVDDIYEADGDEDFEAPIPNSNLNLPSRSVFSEDDSDQTILDDDDAVGLPPKSKTRNSQLRKSSLRSSKASQSNRQ